MLSTTSANHFNFVAADLEPGEHIVTVKAKALSSAVFENGYYQECLAYDGEGICTTLGPEISTAVNEASAYALVQVGSLTVEEVRAVNNDTGIVIEMDQQKYLKKLDIPENSTYNEPANPDAAKQFYDENKIARGDGGHPRSGQATTEKSLYFYT